MRWPARELYPKEWRDWFAWYPVTVGNTTIWLEVVRRRYIHIGEFVQPQYRTKEYVPVDPGAQD